MMKIFASRPREVNATKSPIKLSKMRRELGYTARKRPISLTVQCRCAQLHQSSLSQWQFIYEEVLFFLLVLAHCNFHFFHRFRSDASGAKPAINFRAARGWQPAARRPRVRDDGKLPARRVV